VGRSVGRNAERDPTGIRDKPIAPGSPWQNSFAERLIGSIHRECVDHVIALGEQHLRQVVCARKPRPLDLMRESLNVGRDGRADLAALEPGCLALQVQLPT